LSFDVNDLIAFYATPLGVVVRRALTRRLRARWGGCAELAVMGLGYGAPFLASFCSEAQRTICLMPARQGVAAWPSAENNAAALVEAEMTPLPDNCIDRALVVHGLELSEDPALVLEEVWRTLAPSGRAVIIVPSRRGLWARADGTPFGYGQPFSRGQLNHLLRGASFTPVFWGEALYAPPINRRFFANTALAIESIGAAIGWPFAGVHFVEAMKQVYRPVAVRSATRRRVIAFKPTLAPTARRAPIGGDSAG